MNKIEICGICGKVLDDICIHSKEDVGEYLEDSQEKANVVPVVKMTFDEAVKKFPLPKQ